MIQGGLDVRHLISSLKPQARSESPNKHFPNKSYYPKSLISIATPHRGSPFMDWCMANIGIGVPRPKHSLSEPMTRLDVERGNEKNIPDSEPISLSSSSEVSEYRNGNGEQSQKETMKPSKSPSVPKLPYSLPSPLFSPPANASNYPLSPLSPQSYFSLSTLLLSLIDSPAYSNLTTSYLRDFNRWTRNDPSVSLRPSSANL